MSKPIKEPEFYQWFGPILDALRTLGGSGTPSEVTDQIAKDLRVPDEKLTEISKSGALKFKNQVAWARLYLVHHGFVDKSQRGVWRLTEKGRAAHLSREDAERMKWATIRQGDQDSTDAPDEDSGSQTPSSSDHRKRLREILQSLPPDGFERLVQRLLRESDFSEVKVTGGAGDEGIDGHGILQINAFVSFSVVFQCKRYSTKPVGPDHVRDFKGAMTGRHADKGIILTTGSFTTEARREAARPGLAPIQLIDGEQLIEMFVEKRLGVRPVVKPAYEIDEAFFAEFREPPET